ncbi:MAG: ABC transporter substrate-binding protein [Chloroflexi bacterium]|nr:ABC transporter substrate-binding protein [Chloroflexota bacterium]
MSATNSKLTRRQLICLSSLIGAGTLAAACAAPAAPTAAPQQAEPTAAPAEKEEPTQATEATPAADVTQAPATTGGDVPRNRTLMINWGGSGGKFAWVGILNPWAGMNHQDGGALLWDPLFYYSVFADKEIPWLAESGAYNDDYTELTIKLRTGIEWSDGKPITSQDVKFTFDTQKTNPKLDYHAQFDEGVDTVTAPDDQTVVVKFKTSNPRFKFEVLSFKFDTGIPIVPAHPFEGVKEVTDFKGGEEMPHSGMYNVKMAPEQLVYDLRPDWWGFKTGFQKVPDVKRVIFVPLADMGTAGQRVVNNEMDTVTGMNPTLIRSTVQQNPKITTHTGKDEPLGYIDWWPNGLWMNDQLEPYSDKDVRWAMNYAIDRDTLDKVVFLGAKIATVFPFPEYPALKKYLDQARPLADKLGVSKFSLEESAKLMEKAGFSKDGEGFWAKDGARVNATIHGFEFIHADTVPVLVEMLRKGGFEAAINFGNDAGQNMTDGKPGLYMYGHGGSVIDPYTTLEFFHSRYSRPVGEAAPGGRWSRYKNPDFDKIVDEMSKVAPGDPKLNDLFMQAIEIYWTDMINIPVIQFLHRIPYNQTYWTNWPTQDNPYVNGAFWHWTFPLIVLALKPTQ